MEHIISCRWCGSCSILCSFSYCAAMVFLCASHLCVCVSIVYCLCSYVLSELGFFFFSPALYWASFTQRKSLAISFLFASFLYFYSVRYFYFTFNHFNFMPCYYVYKSDPFTFFFFFFSSFYHWLHVAHSNKRNVVANTWNGHDCEVAHWNVELVTSQNVLSSHHRGKQRRTTEAK